MLKPPRFQSPRLREFAISSVMVLLLACALLAAIAFSAHSPQQQILRTSSGLVHQINHHLFTLPAGWVINNDSKNQQLGASQLTLFNERNSMRTLTIGLLPDHKMRSPAIAMEQAMTLLGFDLKSEPIIQIRTRQVHDSGFLQVSLMHLGNTRELGIRDMDESMGMISHMLVYSDDAREYVVILHNEITEYDPNIIKNTKQRLNPALQLVMAIAQASHNTKYQQATSADLANVGLSEKQSAAAVTSATSPAASHTQDSPSLSVDNRWQLMASQLHEENGTLYLMPKTGNPAFWNAQICGSITPAPSDSPDPYTGRELLAYLQKNLQPADATQTSIEPINHKNIIGWKLVHQTSSPRNTVVFHIADNADNTHSTDKTDDAVTTNDVQTATTKPAPVNSKEDESEHGEAEQNHSDGLVRENWYVQLSPRRVLVAQLIAEPHALKQAAVQLMLAIDWLQANSDKLPDEATKPQNQTSIQPSPQAVWDSAVSRGQQLVQVIRSQTKDTYKTETEYGIFNLASRPIGFVISQTTNDPEDALPLRGRDVVVVLTRPRLVQESSWSSDNTLSRMWFTSQTSQKIDVKNHDAPPQTGATITSAMRSELRDGILTHYDLQAIKATNHKTSTLKSPAKWSYPTTANFLPRLALNALSPAKLEPWTDKPPALIMIKISQSEPEPCWFEVRKFDKLWRMQIRPIADVQSQTLWYADEGTSIHYSWSQCYPHQGGPTQFAISQSNRDTILKAFENLKPDILAWEKEGQPHE